MWSDSGPARHAAGTQIGLDGPGAVATDDFNIDDVAGLSPISGNEIGEAAFERLAVAWQPLIGLLLLGADPVVLLIFDDQRIDQAVCIAAEIRNLTLVALGLLGLTPSPDGVIR